MYPPALPGDSQQFDRAARLPFPVGEVGGDDTIAVDPVDGKPQRNSRTV